MYKETKLSIYFSIFNLLSLISAAYLEAESNYVKPRLERNNIVNKGLWIRNNKDRKITNDFIFRANSLDADNVLQNNYDAFGQNNVANSAFFSGYETTGYLERNKRSNDKSQVHSTEKVKCDNKFDCPNMNERAIGKSKFISTLKPASILDDYPYEISVLLNNKNHPTDSEQNTEYFDKYDDDNKINSKKSVTKGTKNSINKENSSIIKVDNLTYTIFPNEKTNTSQANRFITAPKRSMNQHEYETELIKKIEFTEDLNATDVAFNKIDQNIFDKEHMAWHNAPAPSIDVYKITPQKVETIKNKPVNERGLLKVLSMLTKTFKKIMKQHQDIKRIHNKLYDLNDEFTKNAQLLTSKFEDFNSKYLMMLKFNDELKIMEAKLKENEDKFNNKDKDLDKNLKEFQNQQKKFLAQQRQFYNVQKVMLAQNEKINIKQNIISKTQSEITHRQNNFARILKKAKQIYIDSRNSSPTKLNTAIAKSKPTEDKVKPARIFTTTTTSTSTTIPPPPSLPTTDTVKINLFSIPALTRLENQDQMILDEKDYQPVDELIYKYYFNNTFIDDLMKNKILATFVAASEGADNNIKDKRNGKLTVKTTHLIPVNKTIDLSKKLRNRRWIKHKKHNNHKDFKNPLTPVPQKVVDIKHLKADLTKKLDPFITMALNFCKEIGQNSNLQVLNWCVEKALRRLKAIDLKILAPMLSVGPSSSAASISTEAPQAVQSEDTVSRTETSTTPKLEKKIFRNQTEDVNTVMYFPDNDELESKLKECELKPDTEGTVYDNGSLHASDIARIADAESGGFSDIMPGLDSDSRVQVDPMAFDLQAQRRADVRKINERITKKD